MEFNIRILLLLFVTVSSNCAWSFDNLTCSQNGTQVLFTNGVWADEDSTRRDLIKIKALGLDSSIDANGVVNYDYAYNTNQGYLTDVFEAIEQLIAQDLNVTEAIADLDYWPILDGNLSIPLQLAASILQVIASTNGQTSVDINSIAQKFYDYQNAPNDGAGTKVLAISHSQGGLFLNEAYQVALGLGLDPDLFSTVEIATPASSVVPQGNYVNYAGDMVLYGFGPYPGVPGALQPNVPSVALSLGSLFSFSAWLGHELIPVYLAQNTDFAPVEAAVVSAIQNSALLLGPNCLGCSNSTSGKPQKGDYHQNPGGSKGGFVASTAVVDPSSYIDSGSEVCDEAWVSDFSTVYGKSSIRDHSLVSKYATVIDSTLIGNVAVYNEAQVASMTLDGPITFQGDSSNPTNWVTYMGPGMLGLTPEIHGQANFYLSSVSDNVYVNGDENTYGVAVVESTLTPTVLGTTITLIGSVVVNRSAATLDYHLSGDAHVFHSTFIGPRSSLTASGTAYVADVASYASQISISSGYLTSSYFSEIGPLSFSNVSNITCAPWVNNNGSHCGPGPTASGGDYLKHMSYLPTSGPLLIPPITSIEYVE